MTRTVGIDLGSRRVGLVCGDTVCGEPYVVAAHVVLVGHALNATVAEVMAWIAEHETHRIVIEHGPAYTPHPRQDATPAEVRAALAKAQASLLAWSICDQLCGLLYDACHAAEPPILVKGYIDSRGGSYCAVPCQTWRHRLLPGTSGGISQAMARASVEAILDPESMALLVGDDRLDAAGAWLWTALPPLSPRARGERRAPLTVEQVAERRAAAAERARQRGSVGRRARRGGVKATMPGAHTGRSGPRACAKCGRAMRGHLRGLPCPREDGSYVMPEAAA